MSIFGAKEEADYRATQGGQSVGATTGEKQAERAGGIRAGTPFDLVKNSAEAVAQLRARCEALADRLVGATPENRTGGAATDAIPSGLLGAMDLASRDTLSNVAAADLALSRIEKTLP